MPSNEERAKLALAIGNDLYPRFLAGELTARECGEEWVRLHLLTVGETLEEIETLRAEGERMRDLFMGMIEACNRKAYRIEMVNPQRR